MYTFWLFLDFDSLQKTFLKAKAVIDKEQETPTFYARSLTELEDFVKEVLGITKHLSFPAIFNTHSANNYWLYSKSNLLIVSDSSDPFCM